MGLRSRPCDGTDPAIPEAELPIVRGGGIGGIR